jgi:hypothetical protein
VTQQLVQGAAAKVESETDQRGKLVVGECQTVTIDRSFGYSQILLQEKPAPVAALWFGLDTHPVCVCPWPMVQTPTLSW